MRPRALLLPLLPLLQVVAALNAPPHPLMRVRGHAVRCAIVACEPPQPARTPAEALKVAEAKLEQLQQTNEAPRSFAELGQKPEVVEAPSVPGFVTAAPPFLIALAAALIVLNNFGAFGTGPDLEAFVEWADSL
ncbi:hypothetical protein AB1Y20_007062 [Prymnesium parvum]|uniref:Photosystem I reaction center subunit IX n=1 Tax=Prymnesium parvum TaxID=97485 RepID=A0AB34J1H7_PRYPA